MGIRKRNDRQDWHTTMAFTHRILVTLVTLSVVIFGAFFLIGFDMPSMDEPQFNAPLLTDLVLWYIYALFTAAVVVAMVSVIRAIRLQTKATSMENGIRTVIIERCVLAFLVCCLALTFAFGDTTPMYINGRMFTSTVWLRLSDMLINTSLVLIITAIVAAAFGLTGLNRRTRWRVRR